MQNDGVLVGRQILVDVFCDERELILEPLLDGDSHVGRETEGDEIEEVAERGEAKSWRASRGRGTLLGG